MNAAFVTVSFIGGFLTGLTGVGGGSILTPALILLGINPLAAVSNDLVASLAIKPFGAVLHGSRRTVDWRLLLWLGAGSVPAAFSGALLLSLLPGQGRINTVIKVLVGIMLILTAGMTLVRMRAPQRPPAAVTESLPIRPALTIALGAVAGLLVGLTSIGSGSIIAAGLLLLYPGLRTSRLVGTDLAHSIPLVAAATLGHLLFGQVHISLALTLVVGGIPGVLIGSYLAGRIPAPALRGVLAVLLIAIAVSLLGAPLVVSGAVLVVASVALVAIAGLRRWTRVPESRTEGKETSNEDRQPVEARAS